MSAFSLPNDFKIENDLHGRHQAGAGRRHRARPHPRLHDRRHRAAGDHGAVQLPSSSWRTLDHTHAVDVASLENVVRRRRQGRSARKAARRSTSTIATKSRSTPNGTGIALSTNEHEHIITQHRHGGETDVRRQRPAKACLRARVPQYGKLRFLDRTGVDVATRHQRRQRMDLSQLHRRRHAGGRRSGRSAASTNRSSAPMTTGKKYLPLELIVRVFRTYKGDIEHGIQGSIQLRNPGQPRRSRASPGSSRPRTPRSTRSTLAARSSTTPTSKPIDLLERPGDARTAGVEVVVQCLDRRPVLRLRPARLATSACPTARRCGTSSRPRSASGCRWCW